MSPFPVIFCLYLDYFVSGGDIWWLGLINYVAIYKLCKHWCLVYLFFACF